MVMFVHINFYINAFLCSTLSCCEAPFFIKHTNKRFVEKIPLYLMLGAVKQFQEKNSAKNA